MISPMGAVLGPWHAFTPGEFGEVPISFSDSTPREKNILLEFVFIVNIFGGKVRGTKLPLRLLTGPTSRLCASVRRRLENSKLCMRYM